MYKKRLQIFIIFTTRKWNVNWWYLIKFVWKYSPIYMYLSFNRLDSPCASMCVCKTNNNLQFEIKNWLSLLKFIWFKTGFPWFLFDMYIYMYVFFFIKIKKNIEILFRCNCTVIFIVQWVLFLCCCCCLLFK